jgi:methyl-accepting chemotaxis protein
MKIGNFKIGTRLWMGFGFIICLLIIIVGTSLIRMQGAQQRIDNILEDRYKKVALITQVKYNVALIHQHMRMAVLESNADGVQRETEAMTSLRAKNKELLDIFDKIINVPRAREIFTAIVNARAADLAAQKELLALAAIGDTANARIMLTGKVADTERAYVRLMNEMVDLQAGKMEEEAVLCKSEFAQARQVLIGVAAAALLMAFLTAWYATRSITHPIRKAVDLATRVASGDLTANIEVTNADETGQLMQALKDMNASLAEIVVEVRNGTESIATSSQQIAAGNEDLSSRTEQQAASLEETASSMDELTSTVKQNAENAQQANQLATSASEAAQQGGAVVSEVVQTMGAINESSRKIAEIIGVIDGIAFQTNILALNAAVEAARAGAQGRGFGVVAAEVRNLAQRSAAAAKEIKLLIGDSLEKVTTGTRLADQAGATMTDIMTRVRHVSDFIGDITVASGEQSAGIAQINVAISQMDGVTQQNAALVEEAAAAAGSLREQANRLVKTVGVFKLAQEPVQNRLPQAPAGQLRAVPACQGLGGVAGSPEIGSAVTRRRAVSASR